MNKYKITEIATSMIAFSTFLGVLFAMIYYIYEIMDIGLTGALIATVTYININLLFLLFLKRRRE